MKTNLYNNDGTLSTQAQSLLSPKPDDMSIGEWRKLFKEFKSQLSEEDVKEFDRLAQIARGRAYHQKYKEERNAYLRAYSQKHKEKRREQNKIYYQEKGLEASRQYRIKNKEVIKVREAKRRKTPEYKLRKAVISAFERIKQNKPANTLKLLGCSWQQAKAHIESLWQEGMTWENHSPAGWHIDHIRPVSSFGEDELHLMNKIENLQPLWWQDNLSKSNKY